MSFAALHLLSEVCATTLARFARIDPIATTQSVKGQQASCILFHSVTFRISGSASSSTWRCFCAAPAPQSDVARQKRSSSTGVSRSHMGRIERDAPLRLRAANHGLLEALLLLSIVLNALSHHRLPH